jgi:translation initiation factor IF-2
MLVAGSFEEFQKAAERVQAQVSAAQEQQAAQQAAIAQQQAAAQAAAAQQQAVAQAAAAQQQEKNAAYARAIEAGNQARDAFSEIRTALAQLDRIKWNALGMRSSQLPR